MADENRTTYRRTTTPPPHRDAPRTTVQPQKPSEQKTNK